MPTAIEVLFVLTLTCCLLLLFPYYVGIIVGCCSLIFLFCKRISEEKRHPESAPTSPTAPLDQSDARLVRETRNPDLERRREILTTVEDIRAESKRPSIPCAGKEAILTIENENTDTEKSKRHPKSTPAPAAPAATSNQADTRQVNVEKESYLRERRYPDLEEKSRKASLTIENENTVMEKSHPDSAPVATAAPSDPDQADTYQDNVETCVRKIIYPDLEERKHQKKSLEKLKHNSKKPSRPIPSPGKAILTIENENFDTDYLTIIPSSIELKNMTPVSSFEKASTKEDETRITKTTKFETNSIPDPSTAILTIESEESDTDYSEKRLNTSIELKKSKTTQPLPCSTKAKHLYPKCNSAAQACR